MIREPHSAYLFPGVESPFSWVAALFKRTALHEVAVKWQHPRSGSNPTQLDLAQER
ncbi:hypothetical protein MPS_1171 [Mycobacterium pseudoshottsii JCM 15466]|nr:hypothetical protein MPS_1171 [Mycobacterium pseudoshottsii JCM 15466]